MGSADRFRAVVVDRERDAAGETRVTATLRSITLDDLRTGDAAADAAGAVLVDAAFSSLNYKDGLAVTGRPGVTRVHPIVAGIDLVGVVADSADPRWAPGDRVVLNGAGLSETRNGGYAERAIVDGRALVSIPPEISSRRAAAIGTAGLTAMLSVLALEDHGLTPDAGDVLVTGASGGVGSVAVAILARLGYTVTAATGRSDENGDYLRRLGAAELLERAELAEPGKPLQTQRWAGAVDCVGGRPLANVLAQTAYGGAVTSCGLTAGGELPTTVMPFILRAVSLLGVNSVEASPALRERAWSRLATDLDLDLLDEMTEQIGLADVFDAGERILAGGVRGRTVVDVRA